jgi:hypothetical protein
MLTPESPLLRGARLASFYSRMRGVSALTWIKDALLNNG